VFALNSPLEGCPQDGVEGGGEAQVAKYSTPSGKPATPRRGELSSVHTRPAGTLDSAQVGLKKRGTKALRIQR